MTKTLKVLLVEDEIILQDVFSIVMSSAGYDVTTASNGLEGLDALKKTAPDVLFLDVFMPVLDGIEFLKNFDKDEHADTWVVVYSNLSDMSMKEKVLALGADDFILKSEMSPKDLLNYVSVHSDSHE